MENISIPIIEKIVKDSLDYLTENLSENPRKSKERALQIIIKHNGLDSDKKMTYEELGELMGGISRQRVEQIHKECMSLLKNSVFLINKKELFKHIRDTIESLGSVVAEDTLLSSFSKEKKHQNSLHFVLTLSKRFMYFEESDEVKACWSLQSKIYSNICLSLKRIALLIGDNDLLPEERMIKISSSFFGNIAFKNDENILNWLLISKKIGKNEFNDWGKTTSSLICPRGVGDYAYLMFKKQKEKKLMHFREVVDAITNTFGKKVHYATCHNELVKDPRFALVGRGIYALSEWGYKKGTAKDFIIEILKIEFLKNYFYIKNSNIDICKTTYINDH